MGRYVCKKKLSALQVLNAASRNLINNSPSGLQVRTMNIECPECDHDIDLESEDMPDRACDETEIECPLCQHEFKVGWYATAEYR